MFLFFTAARFFAQGATIYSYPSHYTNGDLSYLAEIGIGKRFLPRETPSPPKHPTIVSRDNSVSLFRFPCKTQENFFLLS